MLILFPFFREVGHLGSNCAVLLSAGRIRRREQACKIRPRRTKGKESLSEEDFTAHRRSCSSSSLLASISIVVVAMPDDVDDSSVRLPNGLTVVPFELRNGEVVPAKLQLQLQHLLPADPVSLYVWPAVDFGPASRPFALIPAGYAY